MPNLEPDELFRVKVKVRVRVMSHSDFNPPQAVVDLPRRGISDYVACSYATISPHFSYLP